MKVRNYRDLIVWQKSMELTKSVYRLTRKFPAEERFALASQIQRAAVSIPSNISEGHARNHLREYGHHLSYAKGSLAEVETQRILAVDFGYISRDEVKDCWQLAQEVGKMLTAIQRRLSPRTST